MKWATSALVHFDRTASAWLIARFVDPDARFLFLDQGEPCPPDATPFGLQGVKLAGHDGATTTFRRIVDAYGLHQPALDRLEGLVAAGVHHVLHDADSAALGARDPLTGGVLAMAEGAMLLSADDDECLARNFPLYDALWARLRVETALQAAGGSVMERTLAFARAAAGLRASGSALTPEAFEAALEPGA